MLARSLGTHRCGFLLRWVNSTSVDLCLSTTVENLLNYFTTDAKKARTRRAVSGCDLAVMGGLFRHQCFKESGDVYLHVATGWPVGGDGASGLGGLRDQGRLGVASTVSP